MRPPAVLLLTALLLPACSTQPARPAPATWVVQPGDYPRAFAAARESLRELGFRLERVDAAAGVITTRFKTTAGLASPADTEQSTFEDELRELFSSEGRSVRIEFRPTRPLDPAADLRDEPRLADLKITVQRYRVIRPNRQVETSRIDLTSYAINPEAVEAGLEPAYAAEVGLDEPLAARLRAMIAGRLNAPIPSQLAPAQPAPAAATPAPAPTTPPPAPPPSAPNPNAAFTRPVQGNAQPATARPE